MCRLAHILIVLFLATVAGCGSAGDGFEDDVPLQTSPVVSRVDPTAGAPGSPITIFGLGYSAAAPNNIVIIGGAAVAADSYQPLEAPTSTEVEAITATVPLTAPQGASSVVVVVHEWTSNADVTFTVTP